MAFYKCTVSQLQPHQVTYSLEQELRDSRLSLHTYTSPKNDKFSYMNIEWWYNRPLKAQMIPGDQDKTFKESPTGTTVWLEDREMLTILRRFIFSKILSRTSWILKSFLPEEREAGAAPDSPEKFYLVQSSTLEFVTGWHWWGPRHCCFYFVGKVTVPSGFPHVANWLWLGVSSLSLTHVIKTQEESWRLIISSWKRKHIPRVIGLWPKYLVSNKSWNKSSKLKQVAILLW